ncbi:NAD(P)H-dependent oxidoreductase [Enterobacter asburiae]|nr:NAD(P)H-dependent oxidoreductase [Enterobacter asburiae]
MSKILIIDGGKEFSHSGGELNHFMTSVAREHLTAMGHSVSVTLADSDYYVEDEIKKFSSSDCIIWQMPGWWMGAPWTVKRYMDEVFTGGHGVFYESDGRTRQDPSKKYGSGGLLADKHYMLSLTWNAPLEAFDDPAQFFGGVGVDGVYLHFHKANEFIGLKSLPTFIANDVVKSPDIDSDILRYRKHLEINFKEFQK